MSFRIAIIVIAFSLGVGAAQTRSGGASLKEAQTTLKQQGYYEGAVDGRYGPQTRAALERYQREHNLKATGHLDSATASSLREGVAGGAVQQTVSATKEGAQEAKQAVRTDESGSADSGKPQAAAKEGQKSAKQGASDASKEAKGAFGELKGALGSGDSSKKKQKTK